PKDLAARPGHEGWTFGAGQSVFAESPNRIFVLQRGELPNIKAPVTKKLGDVPSIFFPIGRLPWRDATVSSPPGNGGTGQPAEGGVQAWERAGNKMGVDARWEHCIMVADGYNGTRVVKFDKDGKYVTAWGQKGNPPTETRPAYFNNVHGIAVDPRTRRVFVNDRGNHRAQVFDENGKFLNEWKFGSNPS